MDEKVRKIMHEMFCHGKLISLSTVYEGKPYARMVNAYYEEGSLFIMTDSASTKMEHIRQNPEVALCGENFNGRGIAKNIGHVLLPEHEILMKTLRTALSEWYAYGDVDETNPNTVILKIQLTAASVIEKGIRYQLFT